MQEQKIYPVQSPSHQQRFSTDNTVNSDLLAKEKAANRIANKYNKMIAYLLDIMEGKEEEASTGERMKAIQMLFNLQEKIIKDVAKEEEKIANIKRAEQAENDTSTPKRKLPPLI